MWITVNNKNATEIQDSVIRQILNLYPEERLFSRPRLKQALINGSISLKELKIESDTILIPWQMFFLGETNFAAQLKHIESQRVHKVSKKLLAKRKGAGNITSKRIIDRLIRQQNFLTEHSNSPTNNFVGCLKRKSTVNAANHILNYFGIDRQKYWDYTKSSKALEYFIRKIETQNINVSRGVLSNKLLPTHQVVGTDVYKNTSGFVIKDDHIPFIFLPSETNPDEVDSRQLYTLTYLLAVIGLNEFNYILVNNFKTKALQGTRIDNRLHAIASELLIPSAELEQYKNHKVTVSLRDSICKKLKVTPTALITALKIRKLITDTEYEELKPPKFQPKKTSSPMNPPRVSTSIRKFCGGPAYEAICLAIQTKSLPNTQAQYLIFGSINKKNFRRFRSEVGI